jgi:hypothetical protein
VTGIVLAGLGPRGDVVRAPFAGQVAAYLDDCARYARLLSPACHPTADGAVKLIWHRGPDQAQQIRAAFAAAAAIRHQAAGRRGRRPGQGARLGLAGRGGAG